MNRVILGGRIGREPELKGSEQRARLMLSIGTDSSVKIDGEWQKQTEWNRVIVWGKRGVALANILEKGAYVVVEGRLKTRSYEHDGTTKYVTEVIADNVELTGRGRRKEDEDEGGGSFVPRGKADMYG